MTTEGTTTTIPAPDEPKKKKLLKVELKRDYWPADTDSLPIREDGTPADRLRAGIIVSIEAREGADMIRKDIATLPQAD